MPSRRKLFDPNSDEPFAISRKMYLKFFDFYVFSSMFAWKYMKMSSKTCQKVLKSITKTTFWSPKLANFNKTLVNKLEYVN